MKWLDRLKISFCCYSKCSLDKKEIGEKKIVIEG